MCDFHATLAAARDTNNIKQRLAILHRLLDDNDSLPEDVVEEIMIISGDESEAEAKVFSKALKRKVKSK